MNSAPTFHDPAGRADLLKRLARQAGFDLSGVCRPEPSEHTDFLRSWLAEGRHGEMDYLARPDAVDRRADLGRTMPEVRSVLVVGHNYHQEDAEGVPADASIGVVARYARGRDYHRVVKKGLLRLHRRFEAALGESIPARAYVDTGPLLERELAQRAGLGWFGRNTMLIHPRRGSYFFLGVLLLAIDVEPDEPMDRDHCGSCRACLDACPTGALLGRDGSGAPVMDARRCISYLTIENPGPIPTELRPAIGNRIYGCDICQEVCPFNVRFAEESPEPGYAARGPGERPTGVEALPGVEDSPGKRVSPEKREEGAGRAAVAAELGPGGDISAETFGRPHAHPGTKAPSLVELMRMSRTEWDAFSRGSAIRRAGYAGFKRNVAVALGNWLAELDEPPEAAAAVLREALEDEEPLVREHAAWALGCSGR